jgi:aminopeptidase C
MELVGMDANGDYVVKNSWGTTWGDGGFVTISAASDCGLTAYVYQLLWGQYQTLSMLLLSLIVFLVA